MGSFGGPTSRRPSRRLPGRRCRRSPLPTPPDGESVIPLRGVRRAIAEKLSRSRREIPDVTIWVDADATPLLEARAAINAARPDQPVSVLALLARTCLSGLRRYPELNARVDTEDSGSSSRRGSTWASPRRPIGA